MAIHIRRRELLAALCGAGTGPIAARAQQPDRVRRVGVLMRYPENDPEGQVRADAFRKGLENLGWKVGRNIQIQYLWGVGDAEWARAAAAKLLSADVILA